MSQATLHTTHGPIEIQFFDDDAPKTVENFRKLSGDGFYVNRTSLGPAGEALKV